MRPKWEELSKSDRDRALLLISGEQIMWRHGKGTNWHPQSLPTVRWNYRVLGAAIAFLRSAATKRARARRGKVK